MAAEGRGVAAGVKMRTKPEIYTTSSGKTIVEDELLNFLVTKMKTMSHDDIVLMTVNHFGSEWIENSKRVLFELCPSTQRNVSYKGANKDASNVKSCLKLLNEVGENIPHFVSHYLDELPPVTFSTLDVSCLLGRIEHLSTEISAMKQAMSVQVSACEDLRTVTVDIGQRLCAVEKLDYNGVTSTTRRFGENQARTTDTSSRGLDSATLPPDPVNANEGTTSENGIVVPHNYARVLKEGRKQKHALGKPSTALKPRLHSSREKKTAGIVGTCAGGNIQAITTKSVSVFATRFPLDLEPDTLASYLKSKLGRDVTCVKIDTGRARFGSFKVTAICREIDEMYEPQLWPEGIYVRRFFEARKPRAATVSVHRNMASENGVEM